MNKNFTSSGGSVTVQYSVTGNCQNKVSFRKNGDFISTSQTSSSITISVSENRGEARTGYVYTYYNNAPCDNNTITITQAAGPCITADVNYQYDNYSGSVEACDTSKTVTVSGVKTTTYRDPSCEQETEQVTTSVTLNFDKNTSSDRRTINSGFTINGSYFTVDLVQPGECVEPCVPSDITFRPNPNQEFTVDGCYTSATITLSGTSVSSYTNCESVSETTTKNVTVDYPKNESPVSSDCQVTVSDVSVTLNRTACGSPQPGDEYTSQYLTFGITSSGKITLDSSPTSKIIEYKVNDASEWSRLSSSALNNGFQVFDGDTVIIKGEYSNYSGATFGASTARFNAYGNIMSLVHGDNFKRDGSDVVEESYLFSGLFKGTKIESAENLKLPKGIKPYCYNSMFQGCASLKKAPKLPATTLAGSCYAYMFSGCTNLETTPVLPVETLAGYCYRNMFADCTSLRTAPALPATAITEYCYDGMFSGCTSLTSGPELPATTLANRCYGYMFEGCTSLTTAPALPAETLAKNCYQHMFKLCTSLTTAPALPAETLAEYCYDAMFANCTSLTSAPELPATTLADYCYQWMFANCTSLTTPPDLPASKLENRCYQAMFQNCTSLETAPALNGRADGVYGCYCLMFQNCTSLSKAPDLTQSTPTISLYESMFAGCTSLNYIRCTATNIRATNCTNNWVNGVAAHGTFKKAASMNDWTTGISGIPENWDVEN